MNLALELNHERQRFLTRRWFFQQCGLGLGSVALASLLGDRAGAAAAGAANPMTPRQPPPFPKGDPMATESAGVDLPAIVTLLGAAVVVLPSED